MELFPSHPDFAGTPPRRGFPGTGAGGGWGIAARILWGLVLAVLAVYGVFFLDYSLALIRYPFDWTEADGNVLLAVKLLEQGRPIYNDPGQFPLLHTVHPPLYHWLVFLLTRLFGVSLAVARSVNVLSAVGLAILTHRIARKAGASAGMSLVASLLLFTYPAGTMGYALGKPDGLFCLLLAAGFCAVPWACDREGSPLRLVLPTFLLLSAAFTKHAGLPGAIAAIAGAFLINPRRGSFLAVTFAFLFLLASTLIQSWSNGWFRHDVFEFAATCAKAFPIESARILENFLPFLGAFAVPLAAALSFLLLSQRRRHFAGWVMFIAYGLVWAYQTGRNGIAPNHCLPAIAAISIGFGIASGNRSGAGLPALFESRNRAGAVLAFVLLLQLLFPARDLGRFAKPTEEDKQAWTRAIEAIRVFPGPVLVDYAATAAVASGKWEFATDSVNLYFGCEDAKELSTLLPLVSARAFQAMLVYDHAYFPDILKQAIRSNYRQAELIPVWTADPDNRRYLMVVVPRDGSGR